MEQKINYVVREVPAEAAELRWVFDDDGLTELRGDWNCNLFVVTPRGYRSFNEKTYENVQQEADHIIDGFSDIADKNFYYWSSYKDVMRHIGITYNPRKCHALKEWAKDADTAEPDDIAAYLTIITGKKWNCIGVSGYCQGDYADVVYCEDHYKEEDAKYYGECWLGCATEYCLVEVENYSEPEDEDEEANYTEGDVCYGYVVSDSQAWRDEDIKRLVCQWAGVPEEETVLERIESTSYHTSYHYRTA